LIGDHLIQRVGERVVHVQNRPARDFVVQQKR
jgi:hypothetical protein